MGKGTTLEYILILAMLFSSPAPASLLRISPDHPAIRYVGRFTEDHRFVPDVIVINLGTNDMADLNGGKEPLPKDGFIAAYKQFINRLRTYTPEAKIIISIGPITYAPGGITRSCGFGGRRPDVTG